MMANLKQIVVRCSNEKDAGKCHAIPTGTVMLFQMKTGISNSSCKLLGVTSSEGFFVTSIAGCIANNKGSWHSTDKPVWAFAHCRTADGPRSFCGTARCRVAMETSFPPQLRSANVRSSRSWLLPPFSVVRQRRWDVWAHASCCKADDVSCTHVYWVPEKKYWNEAAVSWLNWLSFRWMSLCALSWLLACCSSSGSLIRA